MLERSDIVTSTRLKSFLINPATDDDDLEHYLHMG